MAPITTSADAPAEASEEASAVMERIRAVMDMDLDEYDMADLAREVNAELNRQQDALDEAWRFMGSKERGAWKRLLAHRRPRD